MNANQQTASIRPLYLIEFYTVNPETGEGGWEINFAWVFALNAEQAKRKLRNNQGNRFDEVITCEQQAEIVPLHGDFRVNTPDANLFIIN